MARFREGFACSDVNRGFFIPPLMRDLRAGVNSRGLRGAEPPLLKFLIILGGSAPLKILALALLFKVY